MGRICLRKISNNKEDISSKVQGVPQYCIHFFFLISRLPKDLEIPSWTFFNIPFRVNFKNIHFFIIQCNRDRDIGKILQFLLDFYAVFFVYPILFLLFALSQDGNPLIFLPQNYTGLQKLQYFASESSNLCKI